MKSIYAVCGLVLSMSVSGCTSLCEQVVAKTWNEPGLLERFPPEGERNGYSISYWEPPEFVRLSKHAQKGPEDHTPITHLDVSSNNETDWGTSRPRTMSDADTSR